MSSPRPVNICQPILNDDSNNNNVSRSFASSVDIRINLHAQYSGTPPLNIPPRSIQHSKATLFLTPLFNDGSPLRPAPEPTTPPLGLDNLPKKSRSFSDNPKSLPRNYPKHVFFAHSPVFDNNTRGHLTDSSLAVSGAQAAEHDQDAFKQLHRERRSSLATQNHNAVGAVGILMEADANLTGILTCGSRGEYAGCNGGLRLRCRWAGTSEWIHGTFSNICLTLVRDILTEKIYVYSQSLT
uniref:Uncharacterized protein n=1 Tax=Moniliophthora roreri TaxID=221103 RepID=A0A0W0FNW2_MONRR